MAVVSCIALAIGAALARDAALAPGEDAPRLHGLLQPANRYREVDWSKNKLTLVNFWATWCVPCKDEMPRLQKLHDGRSAEGLEIIGVYDPSVTVEQMLRYVEPFGVTYTLLEPNKSVNRDWGGISALPTSFLVDQRGKVLRRYVGALPEQTDGLIADVEAALAGRPLPPMVMPKERPDAPSRTHRYVSPGTR
jgi:thiol-disulfide isomerase/thioredoxin